MRSVATKKAPVVRIDAARRRLRPSRPPTVISPPKPKNAGVLALASTGLLASIAGVIAIAMAFAALRRGDYLRAACMPCWLMLPALIPFGLVWRALKSQRLRRRSQVIPLAERTRPPARG